MRHWLSVAASPGQFPGEFAVGGLQYNNKPFSLFAPAEAVAIPPGSEGHGRLLVDLVEKKGDLALIRLPAQTLENGQYITVKTSELQPATSPEQVAP